MKMKLFLVDASAFAILFVLLASPNAMAQTELPIGVPNPARQWGDVQDPLSDSPPLRPTAWTQDIPGYYFVSYSRGEDAGNRYGTPAMPRRTMPRPIPAGSYVEIEGEYSYIQGGSQFIEGRGTSARWQSGVDGPVWIVSNSSIRGQFVGAKVIVYGSFVYVTGLQFHGGGRIQVGSGASGYSATNIVVRDSVIEGLEVNSDSGSLLSTAASGSDSVANVVFARNEAFNTGNIASDVDEDAHIVSVGGGSTDIWVIDNALHHASGAGVQLLGSRIERVFVARNDVYSVRQSGVWAKDGKDIVFSENRISDIIDTPWSPAKCTGAQYRPQGLWINYNRLDRCTYGVRVPSTDGGGDWSVYVIGNVIKDIGLTETQVSQSAWNSAGIHLHGGGTRYVENNLLFNVANGINFSGNGGSFIARNNLIVETLQRDSSHIWVELGQSVSTITNNVLSQSGRQPIIRWGTAAYELAEFSTVTGQCADCRVANIVLSPSMYAEDPSFLIDAGQDSDLYALYQSTFGVPLVEDANRRARVAGSAIDIGPFEYTDEPPPQAPKPPGDLE